MDGSQKEGVGGEVAQTSDINGRGGDGTRKENFTGDENHEMRIWQSWVLVNTSRGLVSFLLEVVNVKACLWLSASRVSYKTLVIRTADSLLSARP